MIDSHAHVFSEYYDVDKLVKELEKENMLYVLNAATGNKDAMEVIELSKKYKMLLPAVGIHPENINDNLEEIEEIIKNNKVYAIGEIGLDYYWVSDNKEEQKELFKKQIELAIKNKLPVIVHSRKAMQDTFDILTSYNVKGVLHCYSGSYEMAKEFVKRGFKLGIGGVSTFNNSKLNDVIEKIDLKDLLLETDSPYLTPEPFRGQQNKPSYVYYVAKKISEIKGISVEEVINTTTNTFREFFDI